MAQSEAWTQSIKKLWIGPDFHLSAGLKLNFTVRFSSLILRSQVKESLGCVLRSLKAQCAKLTSIQFGVELTAACLLFCIKIDLTCFIKMSECETAATVII